uniref:Uncharacterized protein n=1 Tax=Panagrolaimus sp. JU765 TaxID=591449 RepID=A0AC34QDL6_9BILA
MPQLVKSSTEFFELEEAKARILTKEEIHRGFEAAIKIYTETIDKYCDYDKVLPKNEQLKLQAIIVKLRCLNRRSNLRTKLAADLADSKRADVEKKHLTLQNLEMEIEHLERSIDDLKAVESTDLELVSVEEFLERRNMSKQDFEMMSEHEQQMSLMSLELELRKEYLKEIEELRNQVTEKENQLEEKERKMDAILPQINQVRKLMQPVLQALDLHSVTPAHLERTTRSHYLPPQLSSLYLMQPVLQALDLHSVTPAHLERTARSHYLPPQLSSLYVNVTVYNKINDIPLKYTCSGSIEDALHFEKAHKAEINIKEGEEVLPSEAEEEDDELMDVDMPDSRITRQKEEEVLTHFKQKQKVFQPHPISFSTEVPGENKANLVFNYFPELEIVTVKSILKLKATYEPFLDAETILDELYIGDDGSEYPLESAAILQSIAGTKMAELVKNYGKPYKFVQQMCLVPSERETDELRNDRFKFFLKTIIRMGDRIKTRSVLDVTFRNAAAERPLETLPEEMKKLIPQRDMCKLAKLNPIKPEDITITSLSKRQQAIIEKLKETGQLQNGFQFICAVDQQGSTKIYAIFHIPRSYPDQSSMVLLVPTETEKFEYSAALEVKKLF